MAKPQLDVVVVGGGAMGSAAAWQLARRGTEVALLERFAAGHTRGASHGASRIFRIAHVDPLYIRLAREAQTLWRELEQASGHALLTLTGGIDHGRTSHPGLLAGALEAAGVPGAWLAESEAVERWPGFRYDGKVLFHPDAGRIHADHAVAALQTTAAKLGAVVRHETPVTEIVVHGDEHAEVRTAADSYHARRVVVAVGAWSGKLLGDLVPLPALRVTQEQPAHFTPVRAGLGWPSFIHHPDPAESGFPGEIYGLATPGEGVKVGFHGTGPETDPDHRDFLPDPAQLLELRRYVEEWLPGLDPDLFFPISCTYTTTETSDFVLDRTGPLVVAAGFSGHGFKFVPTVGRILADLALTGERPHPRFALTR